jgi:hypothetical protein
MTQNPHNAIICVGDNKGRVYMHSPNTGNILIRNYYNRAKNYKINHLIGTPLVQMLCHKSAVTSIAIDLDGNHHNLTRINLNF